MPPFKVELFIFNAIDVIFWSPKEEKSNIFIKNILKRKKILTEEMTQKINYNLIGVNVQTNKQLTGRAINLKWKVAFFHKRCSKLIFNCFHCQTLHNY